MDWRKILHPSPELKRPPLKYTIPFLLFPSLLFAQQQAPVRPVLSPDYSSLVKKQRAVMHAPGDPSFVLFRAPGSIDTSHPVRKVTASGGLITMHPANTYRLHIGGSFSTLAELKTANRQPALQHTFAQGRAENGALAWRGAETGELFSFGPAIGTLEFDGSAYPYDAGGRLVPTGTGNGNKAKTYNNDVFRTGTYLSQSLSLEADLIRDRLTQWTFHIKLGQSHENTFIQENRNSSKNLNAAITRHFKHFKITGAYKSLADAYSNSNRNGFLNRVYQNSLLTPASFNNSQGLLPYSSMADNPRFLLENSANNYGQSQQNASLILHYNRNNLELKITQSYEDVAQNSREAYKPGTAYFPGGITAQRDKNDAAYFMKADVSYPLDLFYAPLRSAIHAYYIFTDARSVIRYEPQQKRYAYQRSASQLMLKYAMSYRTGPVEMDADAGNIFYFSNTRSGARNFAPAVNAHARLNNNDVGIDLYASAQTLNSELSLNESLAYTNLLQYNTSQALQYFPLLEVSGYDGLLPVNSRSYSTRLALHYRQRVGLSGEWFIRDTRQDVFPVYENGQLHLKNIAGHRKQGFELQLTQYERHFGAGRLRTGNTISFLTYRHRITQVADAYNYTPIAGFANVHKAIVKGETMGAIVGNTYRRDADHNILIGADGFPLVNGQPQVIGNPVPDFVVKMNNSLRWRMLAFTADWEWRKGGQLWNGTQATLDHYGRSEESEAARDITGHIFKGVLENGHPNNIPVSFYDPAQPFGNNRWVRYGLSGVAEDYIRKADNLRLSLVQLAWQWNFKQYIQRVSVAVYASNIVLWSASRGADPHQLLFDQPGTGGLDFFNLPSTRSYGMNVSLQF